MAAGWIGPFFSKWDARGGNRNPAAGGRVSVLGGAGHPWCVSDLVFVSIAASCPSPSAHGAHRPGGEVRTLLLLGHGRDGEGAHGGTGLREAPQLGNLGEGSKPVGLIGSCWGASLGGCVQVLRVPLDNTSEESQELQKLKQELWMSHIRLETLQASAVPPQI